MTTTDAPQPTESAEPDDSTFADDGTVAFEDDLDKFLTSDEDSARFLTSYVLQCFGRSRRGATVNRLINNWLTEHSLEMFPEIRSADYYGEVEIRRISVSEDTPADRGSRSAPDTSPEDGTDAGWVLSSLKGDAEELDCLQYGDTTSDAIELMQQKNRTKLPVFFSKADRSTLIGTVTLADLSFDRATETTKLITLATTQVPVVGTNEKLFDWVATILQHGFIYGKDTKHRIVQIYTIFDLAFHLNAIAAMFLRANEIEELLREVLAEVPEETLRSAVKARGSLEDVHVDVAKTTKLTKEEINPDGSNDSDQSFVNSLMFAHYIKAVADESIWNSVFRGDIISDDDKPRCIHSLNDARLARNNVMHFSRSQPPENLIPSFEALAVWLRQIVNART